MNEFDENFVNAYLRVKAYHSDDRLPYPLYWRSYFYHGRKTHESFYLKNSKKRHGFEKNYRQEQPTEFFCFDPKQPRESALFLLGGRDILTGLKAFKTAISLFGYRRTVSLYQTYFLRDRFIESTESSLIEQTIYLIELALTGAVPRFNWRRPRIKSIRRPINVAILCNNYHYFLPVVWQKLKEDYPEIACQLRLFSLVESTIRYLQISHLHHPLLLGIEKTYFETMYTQFLDNAGLNYSKVDSETRQSLLKCSDSSSPANFRQQGKRIFKQILSDRLDIDCIIIDSVETFDLLKEIKEEKDPKFVKIFDRVEIIDPVDLTLRRIAVINHQ